MGRKRETHYKLTEKNINTYIILEAFEETCGHYSQDKIQKQTDCCKTTDCYKKYKNERKKENLRPETQSKRKDIEKMERDCKINQKLFY